MTIAQKRKIVEKIIQLEGDIEKLGRVRMELAESGFASASLSSGGGSKSYTRLDMDKVTKLLYELKRELNQYLNMVEVGSASPFKSIVTIYS